jgi:hypothetical protein
MTVFGAVGAFFYFSLLPKEREKIHASGFALGINRQGELHLQEAAADLVEKERGETVHHYYVMGNQFNPLKLHCWSSRILLCSLHSFYAFFKPISEQCA